LSAAIDDKEDQADILAQITIIREAYAERSEGEDSE
jgi:hypothetical protein